MSYITYTSVVAIAASIGVIVGSAGVIAAAYLYARTRHKRGESGEDGEELAIDFEALEKVATEARKHLDAATAAHEDFHNALERGDASGATRSAEATSEHVAALLKHVATSISVDTARAVRCVVDLHSNIEDSITGAHVLIACQTAHGNEG